MTPADPAAVAGFLGPGSRSHRRVALEHAARHGRPGLWVDRADAIATLLWTLPNGGYLDVYADGPPGPAPPWLAGIAAGRTIRLAAPAGWEDAMRGERGRVEVASVVGLVRPDGARPIPAGPAAADRLGPADGPAFEAVAPGWALRSWAGFDALIAGGAAFGVREPGGGLLAVAWTFERGRGHAKLGAATSPRYRRLGLGRAAARALILDLARPGGRRPLWVTGPDNAASLALARSLGFAAPAAEPLIVWSP